MLAVTIVINLGGAIMCKNSSLKDFIVGIAVFMLLLSLSLTSAAAELEPKVVEVEGQYGGILKVTVTDDPKTFNQMLAEEQSSEQVLDLLFEGLVEANGVTGELEPALATGWEYSEDGTIWTFHLRRGVKWHDGKPFTADDVVFTYDVIYDENIPTSSRDVFTIDGKYLQVEKVDDYTVRFILPKPFAPMLVNMTQEILPKHLLEKPWKEGRFTKTWGIDTKPQEIVGTGPFKLVSYKPGQYLVFMRNANYWKVDKNGQTLPYLTRVVYLIVPNMETESLKFQAGETDIYQVRPTEYRMYKEGEAKGDYTLYEAGPAMSSQFIVFNQNRDTVPAPQINWFTNTLFRQAVAHAVDKQAIIDTVMGGRGYPMWSPIYVPLKKWYNPNVKKYEYDLKKAAALLEKAGFYRGEDRMLRDSEGNIVEFNLFTNSNNPDRVAIGNLLSEDLKSLGMKVNFQPLEFNLLVKKLLSGEDWEAIIIGLYGGALDPNGARNTWHSEGNLHMWWPRHSEPATDWQARINEIFNKAAVTLDPAKRKALYDEWQLIASEQVPLIYTVCPAEAYAFRNKLGNANPTSLGGALHNIEEIYVK